MDSSGEVIDMPRAERDPKQPGVYFFRESDDETQARLEKDDLLSRIEALEKHLASSGFKAPAPAKGLARKAVTQQQ